MKYIKPLNVKYSFSLLCFLNKIKAFTRKEAFGHGLQREVGAQKRRNKGKGRISRIRPEVVSYLVCWEHM